VARRGGWAGARGYGGIGSVLVILLLGGCGDSLLETDLGGIIVPADLDAAGPAAIPTLVQGMVGDAQEALDDLARYSALLSDEMILAGTFPERHQVDLRRIQVANSQITEELYVPLHRARFQADTLIVLFEGRLDDPAFADAGKELRAGIARARLYAGFTRIWLAELYCWSILTGVSEEAAPLLPDARMLEAIGILEVAATEAAAIGNSTLRFAALMGQARGYLWLREYQTAAQLAAQVPRNFVFWGEYSNNDPVQFNEVYAFTWGDTQEIRWTVGDGSSALRGGERFPYLATFASLNLVRNRPAGYRAFNSSIPVVLQMLHRRPESRILLASGIEAILLRAEVAVRAGQTALATSLLNELRADYTLRATLQWGVDPPASGNPLQPLALTGSVDPDLRTIAAERARELWLSGDRLTTLRRFRRDPEVPINLFPAVKSAIGGGDDTAFPMVQREIDQNPRLHDGQACPAGQGPGSWS